MVSEKGTIVIMLLVIALLTSVALYPSLSGGLLSFDDDRYVTRNPLIRDFTWEGIERIFLTTRHTVIYIPLVFVSYTVEYHYFDLQPFFYHLTNLVVHLLNCLLVFWFIYMLGRNTAVAFITALLFGVHPLRVESVAWITERKDVLYGFFSLCALVCYTYYLRNRSRWYYALIILLFVLALLSKPAALILPFTLLLCDYFQGGRISKKDFREKVPLLCIAFVFLMIGMFIAHAPLREEPAYTCIDHFFIANYALLFYIYKSVLPVHLSCLYPLPLKSGNVLPLVYLISPLIMGTLAVLVVFSMRFTRKIVFGSLFFLITAFLSLQLFPTGTALVADRFSYLPSIGLSFIIAELALWIYRKGGRGSGMVVIAALITMVVVLSVLTWKRCGVWNNNLALWQDAISKNPDSYIPLAYVNRGVAYVDIGADERAIADFDRALMIYYKRSGRNESYTKAYREILARGDGYPEVYNFIASRFLEIGKIPEATCCLIAAQRSRWRHNHRNR
jgi:hypothetical protein